jgi:hypothetical protein
VLLLEGPGSARKQIFACDGVFSGNDRAVERRVGAITGGGEVFGIVCEAKIDFGCRRTDVEVVFDRVFGTCDRGVVVCNIVTAVH